MSSCDGAGLYLDRTDALETEPDPRHRENAVTATYTFDVFASLDGFGSYDGGDWGGYWGKHRRSSC